MSDTVLKVNDVSMRFNLSKEKVDSLKEYIIKLLKGQLEFDEFWALENIDFQLEKGDRLGILGFNGAGKSTLLKVIAGVFKPTKGSVERSESLPHLLNWEQGLIPNIQDLKISIFMARVLVIAGSS